MERFIMQHFVTLAAVLLGGLGSLAFLIGLLRKEPEDAEPVDSPEVRTAELEVAVERAIADGVTITMGAPPIPRGVRCEFVFRREGATTSGCIVTDPTIYGGKPTVRGTRLAVEHVLARMAVGDSVDDILGAYPDIGREDVLACLGFILVHGHRPDGAA